jgi:hypothetical protein
LISSPLHSLTGRRHASAMVRMVSMLGGSPLDVKYYMLIFLKFIQVRDRMLLCDVV